MSLFSELLWNKTDSVIKQSIDRRKQLEELIALLTKRIDVQESYAKGLEEVAKAAEKVKQDEDNIPAYSFVSFRIDCTNRCFQSRNLTKSVKQQILTPLKQLISQQGLESKQMQKDLKKLDKDLCQYQQILIKNKNKFDQQYLDFEETLMINQVSLQSQKVMKDKRVRIIYKTYQLMKTLGQLQKNYQKSVSEYNGFLKIYDNELSKILDAYQKHEQKRLATQQQNIMKMLIFQTSMTKNIQYDINTITKQLEVAKNHNSILQFVNGNKVEGERQKQKKQLLEKSIFAQTLYKIINKDLEKKLGLQNDKLFKEYIQKKIKNKPVQDIPLFQKSKLRDFDEIFALSSLTLKGVCLSSEQKELLKIHLKDQYSRLAIWMYLHQYQLFNGVVISQQTYQPACSLFNQVLEMCGQFQDIYVARKITNLSFSIYFMNASKQKKYIHYSINSIKHFQNPEYWRAVIFETVQQQLFLNFEFQSEEEAEIKYMFLVLGQLGMLCHQMILLGFSSKQVRNLIGWYCKLYNIPEDRNRDLAKTVNASIKMYKQIFQPQESIAIPLVVQQKKVVEQKIVTQEKKIIFFNGTTTQTVQQKKVISFPSQVPIVTIEQKRVVSFKPPVYVANTQQKRVISFNKVAPTAANQQKRVISFNTQPTKDLKTKNEPLKINKGERESRIDAKERPK